MTPAENRVIRRVSPARLARWGLLLGIAMIALAWIVFALMLDRRPASWFPRARWQVDLLIGSLTGAAFALAAWALLERIPSLKRLEQLIIETLEMDALRYEHAVLFGVVAGFPEEILFRGALQPALGLALTSLLFGALHGITRAYFAYATTAGLLLGWLAIWRDGLWAPVAAHVVIDLIMFALLIHSWRQRPRSPSGVDF
jgi:membrane protease YdiL (CAAX protease family)